MEMPRQRRARKNKSYDKDLYPKGILDIIKSDYPERYLHLSEGLESLFSKEEWMDILTKSRLSYKSLVKLKKQKIRDTK